MHLPTLPKEAAAGTHKGRMTAAAQGAVDGSSPPPLFTLAHSNGKEAMAEAQQGPDPDPVDLPSAQQEPQQVEEEVDVSRAGVLLGQVDTPALACFTEHGAVPYLTQGESFFFFWARIP